MADGRGRTALAGLGLAGGVILLCAALVEFLLRVLAPIHLVGIQDAYRYDEAVGYRMASGLHRLHLTDHLEEIQTNALGSVNFQEDFAEYPSLLFTVGDSYTQGTGLSADASYPFQLDLLLNRDADGSYRKRYGVVNLGLAAFGGEQSLLTLERYTRLLGKPAYVLYLGSDNDYDDDVLFRSGYRHHHIVYGSPYWGWSVRPLLWLQEFELVKRAKLAVAKIRRRHTLGAQPTEETAADRQGPSPAELDWPVIERIAEFCREQGAVFVLSWANPDSGSYAWLQQKARDERLRFADWLPAARSVIASIPGLPFTNPHSGGHWRPWVNRVIAEAYARAMEAPAQP